MEKENRPEKIGSKMSAFFKYIIAILIVSPLYAQDLSIRAFVSDNQVALDGQIQFSVEISGKTTNIPAVEYPDFTDFYVLSGPNSSTSIQWVNGNMTSTKTYSYYLRPKKKGSIAIGKARVKIDGEVLETKPITITVTDPSEKKEEKPKSRQDADIAGENLHLKALVSDRNVYIGEQITVEYKLYFRVNVRGYDFEKLPSNAGFWSEELNMPRQPAIENEVINGVNYNVATLKKYALFPTQTGELTIEPMRVTLEALVQSRRRRSLLDSFFDDPFGRTIQKTVTSKPLQIRVNPLPDRQKPDDFKGAVGRYTLSVDTDKIQAEVNEAIALKVTLSGTGNIKILDLPQVPIPPDIEQYDPKISSNINTKGPDIKGTKTAEYILIPRLPGDYTIKSVSFSYFDPVQKHYKIQKSQPIVLSITGEAKPAAGGDKVTYSRQEVALLGEDIRFIKEQSDFVRIDRRIYSTTTFWMILLSGLVLFAAFVFYNDYQARVSGDAELARSKKAGKMATKRLKNAKSALESDASSNEFYKALNLALQGFVQDKLNLNLSDFTIERARELLMNKGIESDLIDRYIHILEENDFRQYANIPSSLEERKSAYDQAKKILTQLEKWI